MLPLGLSLAAKKASAVLATHYPDVWLRSLLSISQKQKWKHNKEICFSFETEKNQNSTINTKYHLIYCAASCTIKVFGSLFLAMEDANSIFHEA